MEEKIIQPLTVTDVIQEDGERQARVSHTLATTDEAIKNQLDALDEYDGSVIKYVPTPNFTDCNSSGTLLPVNMASETILRLSALSKRLEEKGMTLTDYIAKELHYDSKLGVCMAYSSEQVEGLCLMIEQLKKGRAFILGDMAGIGKGRQLAGVMRWCYWNDIIPVFFTFSGNLFSAMYADIMDIGGFGMNEKGKMIMPKPFIINDEKTSKDAVIIDENGDMIYEPDDKETIYKVCKRGVLPKGNNCIFLTYSQISSTRAREGDNENVKHSFLKKIASKAVLVMDESHIASGTNSIIGDLSRELVLASKGVVFSSATYAKDPSAFGLYVLKTSLSEAQIDITKIEEAIEIGGDNVSEYIASAMVKEGEMVRRERSYIGCDKDVVYRNPDESIEDARREVWNKFDRAMGDFRTLYSYLRGDEFKGAINRAIQRMADGYGYDLVSPTYWNMSNSAIYSMLSGEEGRFRTEFLRDNVGKWIPRINYDTIGSMTKFHFKESLILSVKAKLTLDTTLNELATQKEITYLDGKKHLTNRKPVIAIRSTMENIFEKFNLQEGEYIPNDFSEYTKAISNKCRSGKVEFYKVTDEFFDKGRKITVRELRDIQKLREYNAQDDDFLDGGEMLNQIQNVIQSAVSGIPLSVIDCLREEIQSKTREEWDSINPDNKETRNPNPNYVFLEVTGRKTMLQHMGEGRWAIVKNTKCDKIKQAFNLFNSGLGDVILINSSGSTGESAHSSEKFADQRPRVMEICQSELNINTETQKRGRIHRTGQVNLPAYTYIVSLIPAEIRMLLALRKKMRKLDANTSANQTQSSSIMEITDVSGDPIYDFFNKYGLLAFINDYINLSENDDYNKIWKTVKGKKDTVDKMIDFCRLLELEFCNVQEDFYNDMNQKYIDEVVRQLAAQTYQLELETINYKAALHARVLRTLGYGSSEFSKPLFIEDKFTLETRKTLPKEKVSSYVVKLCGGLRPDDYHKQLLADLDLEYEKHINNLLKKLEDKAPKKADYETAELFAAELKKQREYIEAKRKEYGAKKFALHSTIEYFTPSKHILIPENFSEYQGRDVVSDIEKAGKAQAKAIKGKVLTDMEVAAALKEREEAEKALEKKKKMITPIPAVFMGYKIKKSAANLNKYSEGNIELHFALLSGTPPVLILKPSSDAILLKEIIKKTSELKTPLGSGYIRTIDEWQFDPNRRFMKRFLSGNILSGIVEANDMLAKEKKTSKEDKILKSWELVRYTNFDGTVSTGIRLNYGTDNYAKRVGELMDIKKDAKGNIVKKESNFDMNVPVKHEDVMRYIRLVPPVWEMKTTKTLNDAGFVDILGGWLRVVRNADFKDSYDLHVYNGMSDKKIVRDKDSVLYNKYYWDKDFAQIIKDRLISDEDDVVGLNNNYEGAKTARAARVRVYRFDFNSQADTQIFKAAMNYMWENDKAIFNFKTISEEYYTVFDKEDVYDEKDAKSKSEQIFSKGEYTYTFENTPKEGVVIPYLVRLLPASNAVGRYGGAVLEYPLEPHLLLPYGMYPLNLSYSDTVKLWLNMFDEHEKLRVMGELKKLMDEKKSVREIGNWIDKETATKVAGLKYVFGDLDILQVGELVKTYYDSGDLAQLNFQVEKKMSQEAPKRNMKVDHSSAEKFLIYMLSS